VIEFINQKFPQITQITQNYSFLFLFHNKILSKLNSVSKFQLQIILSRIIFYIKKYKQKIKIKIKQ